MIKNAEFIKEKVDILDVLQHYGISISYNKCACPIHQGSGKNFSIKNGIGTCWSQCGGKSWDAVGFVMEYNTPELSYFEALQELANIGKVEIEYSTGNYSHFIKQSKDEKDKKNLLLELNKAVANAYLLIFWLFLPLILILRN